ncbi:MAG: rod shape-determining protein MreD [Bacteroidetes bacterium]|jgi:rod shape-determining protein MreD|nr:rod shape-determining protein MreD [Bacteroidota bacterium]MBT5531272.1 rod shape-determining protein MreD [Cytophagia bacterium]MBT3421757.1 rod shape-determining protein MreD [Bacteroidota bacterium]MBT3933073.1 rod shape-determining protein MreD [Bacteroidota bacterium]MBT4337507.1 rod shape-determining protein MreD [Bacteroidota bacterium]
MIRKIIIYIVHFLFLVVLQVFVLNNIHLFEIVHPYIYIYFILLLPVSIPKTSLIILAFLLGLVIDVFSNTYGIHAAASTLVGFLRPLLVGQFVSDSDPDAIIEPHIRGFGVRPYIIYSLTMISIHHLALYMLEIFSFRDFGFTLLKILLTILISIVFVLIYELLFFLKSSDEQ